MFLEDQVVFEEEAGGDMARLSVAGSKNLAEEDALLDPESEFVMNTELKPRPVVVNQD